jgi:TatD DNase family protein
MKYDFIDIHTHKQAPRDNAIINCPLDKVEKFIKQFPQQVISVGLHPWDIGKNDEEKIHFLNKAAVLPQVIAIGETGLDKLCQTPFEEQKKIFRTQIKIAEMVEKPLIIHCVKAYEEIIAIKKEENPRRSWIIHGFRGKKELALQLVGQGFYLSFGKGIEHSQETITSIPLDKIFLETDDSESSIEGIYQKAAQLANINIEDLAYQITKNYHQVFNRKL